MWPGARARGKWVVIVDDDFQHSPEAIPLLVDRMRQQPAVDCVLAKYEEKYYSWLRHLGSRSASRLLRIWMPSRKVSRPATFAFSVES